ncbi:MAG: hypothetical protein AB1726_07035 [Planctomycetota bacterium]
MQASVLAAIALGFLAGPPGAVPAGRGSAGPAPSALPQGEQDFRAKFKELMKINATDEMVSMVQKRQRDAVFVIISTCEGIATTPTDELEELIDALRKTWKKAYDTRFVDIQYEYFSLLDAPFRKTRLQLVQRYRLKYKEYDETCQKKDTVALTGIGIEFKGYAEGFEAIGDWYMASECWLVHAVCFDETLRGKKEADFAKACAGYGRMVADREAIELKDGLYQETKARFETLEAAGFGDPAKSKVAPTVAEAAGSAAIAVPTSFELVGDIAAYVRPTYASDEVHPVWFFIWLGKVGESAAKSTITSMGDLSPDVLRLSATDAKIDTDKNGTGDIELPTRGKMAPVVFTVGTGEEERQVAFLATVGQQKDTYQGFEMDLGPRDEGMMIYISPAGSVKGVVGGTEIRVFDDNLDGVYGSLPLSWGHTGTSFESYQVDCDAVSVAGETRARPWSEYLEIAGAWYKLESTLGGKLINATPVQVSTGTLKVKVNGPLKPDWLIVRGENDFVRCYYDVMAGEGKGVQVPRGTYALVAGRVSKGKRDQLMKALIVPPKTPPTYTVAEGETTTIEVGAPYGFDFTYEQTPELIKIPGRSVVVTGCGGETYQRLWNCVVQPEVNARKAGTGRGGKLDKLTSAGSQQEVDRGWEWAWYPFDAEIEKNQVGETVELQLFEKKNKLFGKIESRWK